HQSFSGAIKDIQEARNEQRRLLAEIERANENLIQSEKLAGIGQLAAGVAHEINNPVGYVFSNLRTLAGYVTDLLKIIDAVDEVQDIEAIRRLKNSLEYTGIRDDVEALIKESGEGIDRIKKIISALQDFCHIDTEEFSPHDLHACLDTTLNVATSEIKYKAIVVKEYGDLPRIECNASQINQVILNLIINAAQAIDQEGVITVRTGQEKSSAWFEIQDTGKGIPPEFLTRVFEPFFTTKPVGQGTGLGLALSYRIVQKHHGHIEIFSEPGQGTRIRVWLPIAQPHLFESPE
ncbi:MAG: ATP-binding protein, partial [Castellaniella sp.]